MKLLIGKPPSSAFRTLEKCEREVSWNVGIGQTAGVTLSVTLYVFAYALWPAKLDVLAILDAPITHALLFVAAVFATLSLHELMHIVPVPGALTSNKTTVYFDPRNFVFYAIAGTKAGKWRTIGSLLLPFLSLTALPFVLAYTNGELNGWIGVAAISNAALSAHDLLVACFLIVTLPNEAKAVRLEIDRTVYSMTDG